MKRKRQETSMGKILSVSGCPNFLLLLLLFLYCKNGSKLSTPKCKRLTFWRRFQLSESTIPLGLSVMPWDRPNHQHHLIAGLQEEVSIPVGSMGWGEASRDVSQGPIPASLSVPSEGAEEHILNFTCRSPGAGEGAWQESQAHPDQVCRAH